MKEEVKLNALFSTFTNFPTLSQSDFVISGVFISEVTKSEGEVTKVDVNSPVFQNVLLLLL